MLNFRVRFALACAAIVFVSNLLCGSPTLTTIQDTLYKADGGRFNGILQITWTSFQAGDASNVPTQSVTTQVTNGYLHVLLVPTTNAATPAVYTVMYNSAGQVQYTETWAVPPSNNPLRVSEVRLSSTPGSAAALSQLPIGSVAGLQTELNIRPTIGAGYAASRAAVIDSAGSITGAMGNLSDCIHVDGTSGPCGTSAGSVSPAGFVDAESPAGPIDGANLTFQLTGLPSPASSLEIYRNGLALQRSIDFSVAGSTVTFQSSSVPQPGDSLRVYYRTGPGTTSSLAFADAEVPSGALNGTNAVFGLLNAPSPAMSLKLFRNGLELQQNVEFTLSGAAINFLVGSVPQPGDFLQAFYRTSATSSAAAFVDAETPIGVVDGVNTVFGLANSPNPAASAEIFRNGLMLQRSVDFTISGSTVTFQDGSVPQPGDTLQLFYRTAAPPVLGILSMSGMRSTAPACSSYTLSNDGSNWTTSVNGVTAFAGPAIASSSTQDIPLFALPPKGTLTGIREKTLESWRAAGIGSIQLWIGDSVGGGAFYTPAGYDLTAPAGDTNFLGMHLFKSASDAGSNVIAHLSADGVLNASAIAGSVEIDVCWMTLP